MRAAGGLTLRRGDSSASSGPARLVSIAVVGLSGGEKEKGSIGVGKSCLCNRFVQPLADDYSVDHISVFSQSDFSGRVVNNDHFLYWGDVVKSNEEGTEFHIQVVEHTEFIDDASFQPFRGSGKTEPYVKRCASTKLISAEKLMYICKDQLGIEKEYEQKVMPDGRFLVDGFLVIFDVSLVPNRVPEKQTEFVAQILNNVIKTKKPVVLVATKCDEANEIMIREMDKLLNRREFKQLNIPVIETSAHEGVNIDAAFFSLAQMADRTRGRSRILTYYEGLGARRELQEIVIDAYMRLIFTHVKDYGVLWSTALKKLSAFPEYQHYVDLFGHENAQRLFRRHVKKLKDDFLGAKVKRYLDLMPDVLHQMFPDFDTLGEGDWHQILTRIREHPDFDRYFVEYPEDTTWMEADLFDGDSGSDNRIPFDVLRLPEAENVYENHLNQLQAHQQRLELPKRLRKDFKKLLEELGCVTPGKSINELKVLFLGRECFENLPEQDVLEIYDLHQKEIIQKAKKSFQELLLERSDLFDQFRSSPAGTVTQDDIFDITEKLQEDSRWKALDRLEADRKLILFKHLGFVNCPIREHCPAYPNCTDSLIEKIVAKKATRPPSWSRTSDNNHLNIVFLGVTELANDLSDKVKLQCRDDEFEHEGQIFSLDYRTVSGDVSLPENAFRTQDFLPHGCFCTYSNASSFEYIRDSLEKTLLSNLEQEDRLPFQGLPLVIVFAAERGLDEKDVLGLKEEGQSLAESLQCPFIDVSVQPSEVERSRFNESLVEDALRALIESIRHRSGLLNIYKSTPNNAEPDIRIIMCLFCGDPYSVENVLGPLLAHQNSSLSGGRSIAFETQLGDTKRKVEVILSSYHSATDFKDELIHGFILVYSAKRKASLSTLATFSMNIPELPIQIVAVTENLSQGVYTNSTDTNSMLLAEGGNLADKLNAHFMTSMAAIPQKSSFYTPFFKEVFDKKTEIENAFEDAARLDDSGEGTLERPRRQPIPPPRLDSYRLMRGLGGNSSLASRSGSGSEIYERLPDSGSIGDDLDDSASDEPDSNEEFVDSLDKRRNRDQLVKPSQIKSKRKQQGWVDDSIFNRRTEQDDEVWSNGSVNAGAYTTGRRRPAPPPVKPRSQVPGKLNMSEFQKVTAALNSLQIEPGASSPGSGVAPKRSHAPLAASEDIDQQGYAIPRDNVVNSSGSRGHKNAAQKPETRIVANSEYAQPVDQAARKSKQRERRKQLVKQQEESDSESESSSEDEITQNGSSGGPGSGGGASNGGQGHKKHRKKRGVAIPVATPKVPNLPPTVAPPRTLQQTTPDLEKTKYDNNMSSEMLASPARDDFVGLTSRDVEKQRRKLDKELKQRQKDAERRKLKDEKKRVKEAEKAEKEKQLADKKRDKSKLKANSIQIQATLDDFRASADDPIPIFLKKAISFIEKEGLDAEGLYRVPGNRAHVELLFQKFDEDPNVDIGELDIAVNAVATAVKDFFFKRLPPILGPEHMNQLEAISTLNDRSIKMLELSKLLKTLPKTNFAVIKFIFQHFVRVTEMSKDNCMDSKNLAICWWPTLLQYEFGDLGKFEAMRPHLEDIVQTMIDQFRFLFCGQEEVMMV